MASAGESRTMRSAAYAAAAAPSSIENTSVPPSSRGENRNSCWPLRRAQPSVRAERALHAEAANALEHRRGHRVGERQPADDEREQPEADEERGEEGGRLPQQRRQLAGELDVDTGDTIPDASRDDVGIFALAPADGGARIEILRAQRDAAGGQDGAQQPILGHPLIARILDRDDDEAIGRSQHPLEHTDDLVRLAFQLETRSDRETPRGGERGADD